MEYKYNFDFSDKVRKNTTILLATCMIIGVIISIVQMTPYVSFQIIIISVVLTLILTSIMFFFILYKNWHKNRSSYSLFINDQSIIKNGLYGREEISIKELKKTIINKKSNDQIFEIILFGQKKYRINNYFKNIDQISEELLGILQENKIEVKIKNNKKVYNILAAIVGITFIGLSYYFRYAGKSILVRSIADNIIPLVGGIFLLILPKTEKGFYRGNRKNILSILLIIFSVFQIISVYI